MRFGDIIRDMRAAPLVRVAVPLLLGITWQTQVPLAVPMLPVCLVLAALLPLVHSRIRHYAWRWVFGGVLYGFLWCAGMVLVQQRPQHSALPLGQPIYLWAIVEQERTPGESVVKYTLQVQAMADSTGALQRVQERIVVYLRPTHGHPMPAYADGLVLHTTLSRIPPPANPEEFDYARYLARQGIFVSAFIDARQYWITAHRQAPQPRAWFVELRQQLLHFFERQGLDEEQLAVLQALTLGDKSLLDADLRQSYAAAGAMHILAVSGMHVGIIAMILGWVLSPLARYRYGRLARGVVLLTLLWMYALLAGLSPSVVRATIMFSVLTLGQMQGTPTNVYNNVAFAALVICLANPYALLDAGFQLSFAAVLSIVAFYPRIAGWLYVRNRILRSLWQLVAVSIAANIGTFALCIYFFHQFPLYFLLTNVLITLPTTVIMLLFLVAPALSYIPWVGTGTVWLLGQCIGLLNAIVQHIEVLPGSLVQGLWLSDAQTALLVAMTTSLALYLWCRKYPLLLAVMLCLATCLALHIPLQVQRRHQSLLGVYATRHASGIAWVQGNQGVFITDTAHRMHSFDFNLMAHATRLGFASMQRLPRLTLDQLHDTLIHYTPIYKGYMPVGTRRIKILTSADSLANIQDIPIDVLIVTSGCGLSGEQLHRMYRADTIVIDASVPSTRHNRLCRYFDTQRLPYYSVRQHGAWVYRW